MAAARPHRTVWVSGSAGKLGGEVCRQLRAAGHRVLEADVAGPDPVDLLDPAAVAASLRGADAIIHCAAIPSPEQIDPAELVKINTLTCFNALEQAWLAGIRTAVVASSGSIYGTAWSPEPLPYEAVPVDEDTPLRYVDPYALTKDFTERTAAMYARRGMITTALRFHWILSAEESAGLAGSGDDAAGGSNLWGYVDLGDAARACLLALDPRPEHSGCEVLVIAAAETLSATPTEQLLDRYLPEAERLRPIPGTAGGFDTTRAERTLGWRPEHRLRR